MQVLVVSGQVVVRVRIRLGRGCGTTSCLFQVRFEYRCELVLHSMRSGSLFDYGGDVWCKRVRLGVFKGREKAGKRVRALLS